MGDEVKFCPSTLTVWHPEGHPSWMVGDTVDEQDQQHLVYHCVRPLRHEGSHGWCQGFDADWTYRWSDA